MTRSAKLAIAAAAVCVAVTPTAHAAKPSPSGSTAPAQVFFPNPVQSLRDETLTDQKDANYPALAAAYARKTLTDLDGSGTLTGAYAKVESETGTPARNTGNGFIYTRDQDQFEQVMAYYWLTQAQRYIQSLGFGTTLPSVNKRQQLVRINQFGGDNSFYRNGTKKLTITYGKGGVDRRGIRRLPRGHGLIRGHARDGVPGALRGRLGLDLVHARPGALPAPARQHQALPAGRRG